MRLQGAELSEEHLCAKELLQAAAPGSLKQRACSECRSPPHRCQAALEAAPCTLPRSDEGTSQVQASHRGRKPVSILGEDMEGTVASVPGQSVLCVQPGHQRSGDCARGQP